jgi:hypothetical protein
MRLLTISALTILLGFGSVATITAAEEQVVFQASGNGARRSPVALNQIQEVVLRINRRVELFIFGSNSIGLIVSERSTSTFGKPLIH